MILGPTFCLFVNLFYVQSRQLRSALSHACIVPDGVDETKGNQPDEMLFISDARGP